jgi:hypothetical protein
LEKKLRLHVPVVAVVMLESRLARCVHCEEDVGSFVKRGFLGWGIGQLNQGVARVLFGNEFPFVEGLYEEKFVWD